MDLPNLPPCKFRHQLLGDGRCVCKSPDIAPSTVSLKVCTGEAWGLPDCKYREAPPPESRPIPKSGAGGQKPRIYVPPPKEPEPDWENCKNRGDFIEKRKCTIGCSRGTVFDVYHCEIFGECATRPLQHGLTACRGCQKFVDKGKGMEWSYGVTTVPQRQNELLPRTLASLRAAGFPSPRLFVDGAAGGFDQHGLPVTYRPDRIRAYGNWILALWELYLRKPNADRYAIFQDDLVAVRNLREYLEKAPYPEKGYQNLYTFPVNQKIAETGKHRGWFKSNQAGQGAVGLVFSLDAVKTLLTAPHVVRRVPDVNRGHKAIDGGVVQAMHEAGWKEYCHNPSLIQHTGKLSSMGNGVHPTAPSFPGEEYDALELLAQSATAAS